MTPHRSNTAVSITMFPRKEITAEEPKQTTDCRKQYPVTMKAVLAHTFATDKVATKRSGKVSKACIMRDLRVSPASILPRSVGVSEKNAISEADVRADSINRKRAKARIIHSVA